MNYLKRISQRTVYTIILTLILLINVGNFTYFNPEFFPFKINVLTTFLLGLAFAVLVYIGLFLLLKIKDSWPKKDVTFFLLATAFIVRVLWVLLVPTPPTQDYAQMLDSAFKFSQGEFTVLATNRYVELYPFVTGFVIYQAVVLKLFFSQVWMLKVLNIVWSVGTVWISMKISKKLFGSQAANYTGLILALYVPSIVVCSVLTNDILATFLLLMAIYLFIKVLESFKVSTFLSLIFCLILANFIRPLASIVVIAMTLYGLFIFLPKAKRKLVYLVLVVALPVSYTLGNLVLDKTLMAANITPQSIRTVKPSWKLAMGLNPATNGKWTIEDFHLYNAGETVAERDMIAKELLLERLEDKKELSQLLVRKYRIMWSDIDSNISWATKKTKVPKLVLMGLSVLEKTQYSLILILVALTLYKKKFKADDVYLLLIILIGYILAHFGIEIQTRYRYFVMPLLIILASQSLSQVAERKNIFLTSKK